MNRNTKIIAASFVVTAVCSVVSSFYLASQEERAVAKWRSGRMIEYAAWARTPCILHVERPQAAPIYECFDTDAR